MAGRACSVDPRGGERRKKTTKILQTQQHARTHTLQGPRRGVLHVRLLPATNVPYGSCLDTYGDRKSRGLKTLDHLS